MSTTHVTHVELECETCRTAIRLTVIDSTVEPRSASRMRVTLNELLVDYGWLPARSGQYCRHHAELLLGR